MLKKYLLVFGAVLVLAVGTAACSNLTGEDGSGQLVMELADKPVNGVDKVLVAIDEVQVKREDSDWTTLNDFSDEGGEKTFDLMKLRFDEELLGQEMLPNGHYEQIRLIVAADEAENDKRKTDNFSGKSQVVYENEEKEDIFIPSGTQTGLKIDHDFQIEEDVITRLLLDADVSDIMHEAGESGLTVLRPTAIDVVDKVNSGDIKGQVLTDSDKAVTEYDVVVEASDKDGNKIKSTVALDKDEKNDEDEVVEEAGTFLLRGLPEGSYSLTAYPVDEDGKEVEDEYEVATAEDIKVRAEKETKIDKTLILEEK